MCTQDRLVKLSSEVHRLGIAWALSVPTDESVAEADGWIITFRDFRGVRGLPAHVRGIEVVSDSLDGALDLAIEAIWYLPEAGAS